MTPKSVLSVDFKEINAVEIRCACGSLTTLPLPLNALPEHFACMSCNKTLWFANEEGGAFSKVQSLVRGLSLWKQVEKAPFTLGFSLEGK